MSSLDPRIGPTDARDARRVALGGVAFEFQPDASVAWRLPSAGGLILPLPAATQAEVVCRVSVDRALPPLLPLAHGMSTWRKTAAGVHVTTAEIAIDVREVGERRYEVAARIGSASCISQLLLLLTSVIVELSGGLCLHATAIELDGRAVLLLGPSGAGKTTAAQLLGPVRCLANDRVAAWPSAASGWSVWALPGGSPPRLERSRHAVLPLAGFLRVVHAPLRCSAWRLRLSKAALYLREAVEVGLESGFMEARRLEAVSALALAAPGGSAEVVLGQRWLRELRSFLHDGSGT